MTEGCKGVPFSSLGVQAASLHEGFLFPNVLFKRDGMFLPIDREILFDGFLIQFEIA